MRTYIEFMKQTKCLLFLRRTVFLRASILLTLLILACSTGFAEPPIAGTVTGARGEAIEGVLVTMTLRSGTRVMSTDSKGMFRFEGLGTGTYGITFEKDGYVAVTRDVTLTFDDDTGIVNIKMQPASRTKPKR
jgi:hypothetical protein